MKLRDPSSTDWERYRTTIVDSLPQREAQALQLWSSSFYPFQQRWLFEPQRFAICNKSRQTGFSHTTGALAVLWAAFFGETTTIVSVGEREAVEVLDKSKRHAEVLQSLGSSWAKFTRKKNDHIQLASGGRVIALPRTSGGRSFSGNIFLDELAYGEHVDKLWDAAAPTILHGYRMRVASTPNGVGNLFHQLWTGDDDKFARHEIPIEMAIADGMDLDMDDCWTMAKGDERLFGQMFRCQFLDGELQYIPTRLIEAATVDQDQIYCPRGQTWAGLDIGRENDLTALVVIRQSEDEDRTNYLWHVETCKRTAEDDIDRLASLAINHFGVSGLFVDSTGLGTFPTDNLQRRYGPRVQAYPFTNKSKEVLATTLYCVFADGRIRMGREYEHTEALAQDVASIQRITTPAGNIQYEAPRTSKGHADRAWGLALALHGCNGPDRRRHEVPGP